ncbi:MAG: MFS transporter [Proteobacteria bacterium]|nr:MFS transporter [Pseudomonadota bacterium]
MSDAHYRWVVVAYTMMIQAVSLGILIYSFTLFAVPWLDEFGSLRRDVMLTIALLQFGTGLASPFVGRALDRFRLRSIVLTGLAFMLLGLAGVHVSQTLWQLQIVYASLFPLSTALMGTLTSQTLIARWFNKRRGLAIGISATGTNIGGMVFPMLVGLWLVEMGWRDTVFWLGVVAAVVVGPATWLILSREPPKPVPDDHVSFNDERQWSTREILTNSMFWIPVVCMLPLNTAFGAIQFNLGAYSRDLGLQPTDAASLVVLSSICMILGKFFFGGLADRLDHRRLYWISAFFMALALFILRADPSVPMVVAGVICMGLSGGGILPLMGVVFGSRFGVASFGRVMGLVMLTITFGAAGPLIAGWLYDLTGSYATAFTLFLISFLPAVVAIHWMPAGAVRPTQSATR